MTLKTVNILKLTTFAVFLSVATDYALSDEQKYLCMHPNWRSDGCAKLTDNNNKSYGVRWSTIPCKDIDPQVQVPPEDSDFRQIFSIPKCEAPQKRMSSL